MAELNDNEVLSILNSMITEQKQWERQRAAFAYAGDVIARFNAARGFLAGLSKEEAAVKESIVNLQARYERENAELFRDTNNKKSTYQAELDTLSQQTATARTEYEDMNAKRLEAKLVYDKTVKSLEAAIQEKQKVLETVTKRIESLTKEVTAIGGKL